MASLEGLDNYGFESKNNESSKKEPLIFQSITPN
jgi:hypothetical protein